MISLCGQLESYQLMQLFKMLKLEWEVMKVSNLYCLKLSQMRLLVMCINQSQTRVQ